MTLHDNNGHFYNQTWPVGRVLASVVTGFGFSLGSTGKDSLKYASGNARHSK